MLFDGTTWAAKRWRKQQMYSLISHFPNPTALLNQFVCVCADFSPVITSWSLRFGTMLSLWHDTLTSIYRILVLRCEPDGEVVFHQLMELMLAQLDSYLATAVSMNSCHFSPRNRQLWSSNEKPAFVCIFVKTKAPLFQNISENRWLIFIVITESLWDWTTANQNEHI